MCDETCGSLDGGEAIPIGLNFKNYVNIITPNDIETAEDFMDTPKECLPQNPISIRGIKYWFNDKCKEIIRAVLKRFNKEPTIVKLIKLIK